MSTKRLIELECAKLDLKKDAVKAEAVLLQVAAEAALNLKTVDMNRRLDLLNELRKEVVQDRDQFIKKDAYTQRVTAMDQWVTETITNMTRLMSTVASMEQQIEMLTSIRNDMSKDRAMFVTKETYDLKTNWYDQWVRGVEKKFAYWGGAIVMFVFVMNYFFRVMGK